MLDNNHVLAAAYKKCADFYAERKAFCDQNGIDMPQFRMTLMNKRKAVEQGADINQGIHDHRLLLPTNEGLMQCATVGIFQFHMLIFFHLFRFISMRMLTRDHRKKEVFYSLEKMAVRLILPHSTQILMRHFSHFYSHMAKEHLSEESHWLK
jgi:hypothetical protein